MIFRNKLALFLTLLSVVFLYPGITLPMLSLNLFGQIDSNIMNKFDMKILEKENSILQTVVELYDDKNLLVAFLILFFSVIVPLIKAILISSCVLLKDQNTKKKIINFVKSIGKWSMADVFVVGIFLAYLSTRSQPTSAVHEVKIMGFNLKVGINMLLSSKLGMGFYFFLAYCLSSLSALQLFSFDKTGQK